MKIQLSNYIIKAYKKRTGYISFHLRTHILINTKTSFNAPDYYNRCSCHFKLSSNKKIEFNCVEWPLYGRILFDGKTQIDEIYFYTISDLTSIKESAVDLVINNLYSYGDITVFNSDEYKFKGFIQKYF